MSGDRKRHSWLVTGAAGFIGSHLVEKLLSLDEEVIGLDDFSTGRRENLEDVRASVSLDQWSRFRFYNGDIRDPSKCIEVGRMADFIVHLAAMASVPVSMERPALAHEINVKGFLNILLAAKEGGARKVVYASSSAIYGDCPRMPLVESDSGTLLSPYAGTKRINEIDAQVFASAYGLSSVGLRFFNVYGPRQNPDGAYAAVIPRWMDALASGSSPVIFGDGTQTRGFCYVSDVVDACWRAAVSSGTGAEVYNVSGGDRISLNELFGALREVASKSLSRAGDLLVERRAPRAGDIQHSGASIAKIGEALGFVPQVGLAEGLDQTLRYRLRQGVLAGEQSKGVVLPGRELT